MADVLVVGDDGELRSRLERNGWSDEEAENGALALKRVQEAPPHMILLDLTMPVMHRFAFLHRLRDSPGCTDVPVLVLTAQDISGAERERLAEADLGLGAAKGEASLRDVTAELRRLSKGGITMLDRALHYSRQVTDDRGSRTSPTRRGRGAEFGYVVRFRHLPRRATRPTLIQSREPH